MNNLSVYDLSVCGLFPPSGCCHGAELTRESKVCAILIPTAEAPVLGPNCINVVLCGWDDVCCEYEYSVVCVMMYKNGKMLHISHLLRHREIPWWYLHIQFLGHHTGTVYYFMRPNYDTEMVKKEIQRSIIRLNLIRTGSGTQNKGAG